MCDVTKCMVESARDYRRQWLGTGQSKSLMFAEDQFKFIRVSS